MWALCAAGAACVLWFLLRGHANNRTASRTGRQRERGERERDRQTASQPACQADKADRQADRQTDSAQFKRAHDVLLSSRANEHAPTESCDWRTQEVSCGQCVQEWRSYARVRAHAPGHSGSKICAAANADKRVVAYLRTAPPRLGRGSVSVVTRLGASQLKKSLNVYSLPLEDQRRSNRPRATGTRA